MEVIISALNTPFSGLLISLNTADPVQPIAIVNGNKADFSGPVILLSLDQEVIYGLSQPTVISRIFAKGPQQLLSTKELSHNLFEHGMKASLGKVKVHMNTFLTSLETFYSLVSFTPMCRIIPGRESGKAACLLTPSRSHQGILIHNHGFEPKEAIDYKISDTVEIDNIRTYISIPLKI